MDESEQGYLDEVDTLSHYLKQEINRLPRGACFFCEFNSILIIEVIKQIRMKVLIVYTHPVKTSFNRALLKVTVKGLEAAGHEIKVADLYAENFQPAMTAGN